MPLARALAALQADVAQCDSLIVNAHRTDAVGAPLFPALDRKQITVAAFLNFYVAWETFLEASLSELMAGAPTISGRAPVKYVAPPTADSARKIVIGAQRFFDYGNPEHIRKIVNMYFDRGYPYEPHMSSVMSDLNDLRTLRNASAHISSTTQTALEGLAQRILTKPAPGIDLYTLLTTVDPRATGDTVFVAYRKRLVVAAELIAKG